MPEKLSLKWAEFNQNISSAFGNFRGDNDLVDVTLACVDGHQMEAHKVILAASSPTFRNLFSRNKHSHPLIFMTGVKSSDLSSILDFLYFGEANVGQIDLESFLAIADQLQLDGLMGSTTTSYYDDEANVEQSCPKRSFELKENGSAAVRESSPRKDTRATEALRYMDASTKKDDAIKMDGSMKEDDSMKKDQSIIGREYLPPAEKFDDAIKKPVEEQKNFYQPLDLQVQSMMEMTENTIRNGQSKRHSYLCKVCGKEGHGGNIKKHIEANHLEGLSVPCNLCEKRFRSRNGLRQHKVVYHQQQIPTHEIPVFAASKRDDKKKRN